MHRPTSVQRVDPPGLSGGFTTARRIVSLTRCRTSLLGLPRPYESMTPRTPPSRGDHPPPHPTTGTMKQEWPFPIALWVLKNFAADVSRAWT